MRFRFDIDQPGDMRTSIRSFTDTVTVTIASGDLGGDPREFMEFMQGALAEWYDGAIIGAGEEEPDWIDIKERQPELGQSARDPIGAAMREGYCCDCENLPSESIIKVSKIAGSQCNGCWTTIEKPNWRSRGGRQYYANDGTLMNADGTRSIFDDVDL